MDAYTDSLKELAAVYLDAHEENERAQRELSAVRTRADNAKIKQDNAARALKARVGSNVPRRVITTGERAKVVCVEYVAPGGDANRVTVDELI